MNTDPRLEEIEGRLSKATPGPWVHQSAPTGIRNGGTYDFIVLPQGGIIAERHVNGTYDDAEFIAHSPTDVAYLLAELRKAQDKVAKVSDVLDNWQAEVPFQDAEESQRWYSLGKRHAAERIRYELAGMSAAVADATGGERG